MFLLVLGVLTLISTASAEAPEQPSVAPPPHPAVHVSVRPVFKSGPRATFPDQARNAGEFGKVVVAGTIGVDGRFSELSVAVSSRSASLDASALEAAAASIFEPAKDEGGNPIAIRARMPFEFSNAKTPGPGGGALRYKCGQFARDYDWWRKTWGSLDHEDFYLMALGLSSIAKARDAQGRPSLERFAAVNQDFEARWWRLVEDCRAQPEKLMIDVFKPEGDWFRRMAGG